MTNWFHHFVPEGEAVFQGSSFVWENLLTWWWLGNGEQQDRARSRQPPKSDPLPLTRFHFPKVIQILNILRPGSICLQQHPQRHTQRYALLTTLARLCLIIWLTQSAIRLILTNCYISRVSGNKWKPSYLFHKQKEHPLWLVIHNRPHTL